MTNKFENSVTKRKTLSLNNDNKSIDSKKRKTFGNVAVEIRRRRTGLNRKGGSPLKNRNSNDIGAKLTDTEFKTRVKALQNAMKEVSTPVPETFVSDISEAPQNLPQKNKLDTHNSNSNHEVVKERENIIDQIIEMASKTKSEKKIKPVVFRSASFIKKTRPSVNPKTTKSSDQPNRRNDDKKGDNKKNITKSSASIDKQNSYVSSPISKYKTQKKPVQKPKISNEEKTEDSRKKLINNKFSKKDIDRAMNDDFDHMRSFASISRAKAKKKNLSTQNKKVVRNVDIPDSITVGDLANRMAVQASEVVKYLMSVGTMATINQVIDGETAEIICTSFGHNAKRVSENDFEKDLDYSIFDTPDNLQTRAPVIAVMGHVDHGKTTLLDTIRNTSVTKKEAGGITQHVAAYHVITPVGRQITFIDTPGHAAFKRVRHRGTRLTDIIVLVVAADDGIKEQTIEIINEAKKNNVPIIVAINKVDKPDVNVERVKSDLMQYEILLEEFGGDVQCVEISAKNNKNIDKLLDAILLQADVLELKANPNRKATCTILETRIEKGRGIVATVVVNGGTLHIGDAFVAGATFGKVRTMTDCYGNKEKSYKPSIPVEVVGFDKAPEPGDILVVVDSEKKAHEIAERRQALRSKKKAIKIESKNVTDLLSNSDNGIKTLNVYIKADVFGSLDAVEMSLLSINSSNIRIDVIGRNIGIVNESDIEFAKTFNACILCFNVGTSTGAKRLAKSQGVRIISNNIIYGLIDEVTELLESMLPTVVEEKYIGCALVKKLFFISRLGTIAGCIVTDGIIKRNNSVIEVTRNKEVIYKGKIKSMKHEKDEIKESSVNHEVGILLENFNDYKEQDELVCYECVQIKQKIR